MMRNPGATPLLAIVLSSSCILCHAADAVISNGHFSLQITDSRVTSLCVDPRGQRDYGPNWLIDMGFEGLAEGSETEVTQGPDELAIRGLKVETDIRIELESGGVPSQLKIGHTLGQTFEVQKGQVARLSVHLPTWHTADSSATLSLRRDGPEAVAPCEAPLQRDLLGR